MTHRLCCLLIVKTCHGVFLSIILDPYRQCPCSFWSEDTVDRVEANHREILKSYHIIMIFLGDVDKNRSTKLNDAWNCVARQFEQFCSFCGVIATVIPNKTLVKSDMYILKWRKDDGRKRLMNLSLSSPLSLEGTFQEKQQNVLKELLR